MFDNVFIKAHVETIAFELSLNLASLIVLALSHMYVWIVLHNSHLSTIFHTLYAKVETLLRMRKVPCKFKLTSNPSRGPTKKLPWLSYNNLVIGDSSIICTWARYTLEYSIDDLLASRAKFWFDSGTKGNLTRISVYARGPLLLLHSVWKMVARWELCKTI